MLQVVTMIFESVELEVIDSDTDDRQLFSVKL